MDCEGIFFKKYDIVKWDEFTVLNSDRASVDEKIRKKVITKCELLSHLKVELSLLNSCKQKIKAELEKIDVIDTQILVLLCKRIIDLFDHLHVFFSIEEELLHYYINFCQDNVSYINVEQLCTLLAAVLRIKNNQNIWIQLIKLHLNYNNNLDELMKVFQEGVRSLKNDSLPLWKILIRHLQNKRPDMVQILLEEGSNISYENISSEIRPKYLEWCMEFKGIDATRDLFNQLKDLQPQCCKLYLAMIAIEREEPNCELDAIRKMYDDACDLFGRSSFEVWIDYMRFEQNYGCRSFKYRICNRALFRLDQDSMNTLMDEAKILEREFWAAIGKDVIVIDD